MASPLLILRDMLMSRSSQLITSLQSTFNATHRALAIATTLGLAFAIYQWRKPQSASKQTSLSTSHATPPLPCRYNTSNSTSSTITLPDGRKLGYAQYGASAGRPIFFLHGLATTRIDAAAYDEVAKELNVRIIAPDRPGTGLSSPQPGRTLLDYPKDIDMLATYLGISEYGILGSSGGGSHALACAHSSPSHRLRAVTILSGLGPPDIGMRGMNWYNYLGFTLGFPYAPWLCAWVMSRQVFARPGLTDSERFAAAKAQFLNFGAPEKDRMVVEKDGDLVRLWMRACSETFAQGMEVGRKAVARDGWLNARAFGFRVEDVRRDLPVRLWYGTLDTNVPPQHGREIARRLGERDNVKLWMVEETHISLQVVWRRRILEDLVESMGLEGEK